MIDWEVAKKKNIDNYRTHYKVKEPLNVNDYCTRLMYKHRKRYTYVRRICRMNNRWSLDFKSLRFLRSEKHPIWKLIHIVSAFGVKSEISFLIMEYKWIYDDFTIMVGVKSDSSPPTQRRANYKMFSWSFLKKTNKRNLKSIIKPNKSNLLII